MLALFENRFIIIKWNEQHKYLFTKRIGFCNGEDFRMINNRFIELVKEKTCSKQLTDTTEMKVVAQEDQQWFTTDYLPRLKEAGLRYLAVVLPTSALAKLSVQAVQNGAINNKLETAYFDKIAEAEEWLNSK